MKKKLLLLVAVLALVGCDMEVEPDAERTQQMATKEVLNEINRQIGMPNITNYFEKKMAKEIFELRDNSKLITYAYTQNLNGEFIYLGKCIGYGLPYSVQYTNPEKIAKSYSQGGFAILPQADPNGLYMPSGLSATWLMIINEKTGKAEAMYIEQEVIVRQSKMPKRLVKKSTLTIDY